MLDHPAANASRASPSHLLQLWSALRARSFSMSARFQVSAVPKCLHSWFGSEMNSNECETREAASFISGPETGKRKLVTRKADGKLTESWRKADGKLTLLVSLEVLARKADAFGYPFQLTHFSLPISGPPSVSANVELFRDELAKPAESRVVAVWTTPSPPIESFPTKSPWVKLSRRLPIEFYGHDSSYPLELRVCLSQTLWNPNS